MNRQPTEYETERSAEEYGANPELQRLLERCGHFLYHRRGEKFGQRRILAILWEFEQKQAKERGQSGKSSDCSVSETGMPQQELMERLGIRAGSLSEIIGKMEENGLVCRARSEEDRRKICISLTEKGCCALEKANQAIKKQEMVLFLSLSLEEQETMCHLLEKLLDGWEQQFDAELLRGHHARCRDREQNSGGEKTISGKGQNQ
ncbi:MAG: MarR family winged helix-turn-helix transcriptional regulator [Fusicatenibacter sp.]|nr:winged helix DNA-binding protein [Fusicatenibacter sp.]